MAVSNPTEVAELMVSYDNRGSGWYRVENKRYPVAHRPQLLETPSDVVSHIQKTYGNGRYNIEFGLGVFRREAEQEIRAELGYYPGMKMLGF